MSTTIHILATNDIHGRFLGGFGEPGQIDFSKLRTYKEQLGANALLVDIGDSTQGTLLAGMNKGLDSIKIMNSVGYDVTTIGNHEFDNITLKEGCKNELDEVIAAFNAPFICANVFWKKGVSEPQNYINYVYEDRGITDRGNGRYLVKEIAGKKLLFVGVCTDAISKTPKMKTYLIKGEPKSESDGSMDAEIRFAIADAKKVHGVFDAVILLTHLGKDSDECSSSKLIDRMTPADKKDIKLIIDGHSHKKYFDRPAAGSDKPYLIQADCYGKLCAHLKLVFDDAGGLKIENDFLGEKDFTCRGNTDVGNTVSAIKRNIEREYGASVSSGSNATLWGGAVDDERPFVPKDLAAINITRYVHTNMGRLAAETMADYIRTNRRKYFDSEVKYIVAGINGGGVRDSLRFGQSINCIKLYNVAPSQLEGNYDSGLAVFKISIERLKTVLEHSISKIEVKGNLLSAGEGRFLNTFGIKYTINPSGDGKLSIDDSAILTYGVDDYMMPQAISFTEDKDKKILLCVNKYLANKGDEYPLYFDEDRDLIADSLGIDTAIFMMMGDYIRHLSKSSDNILFYPSVSDDVQYIGFKFPKPTALNVTVKDDGGKPQKDATVVHCFVNGQGYYGFGVTVTDRNGTFSVIPPEGANTLCVAVLLSKEKLNDTFLYGEVFTHSYIKMERTIECQVGRIDSSAYNLFSKNNLSQFHHSYVGSKQSHHSNYLVYVDENGKQCTLTIVNNKIYRRVGTSNSFSQVDSVTFTTPKGVKATLSLPFPKEGIDYVTHIGALPWTHADLIVNPEISEYYGGGDKVESSTYYDGTVFAKNHKNRVTGLHIRSGQILDGIGFVYDGDEEFFFGNPSGGAEQRYKFIEGEYIRRIEGGVNDVYPYYYCVTNLKIITNKRMYGPFGSLNGKTPFVFEKPGKKITAVLGEETTQEKWRLNLVKRIAVGYTDISE